MAVNKEDPYYGGAVDGLQEVYDHLIALRDVVRERQEAFAEQVQELQQLDADGKYHRAGPMH